MKVAFSNAGPVLCINLHSESVNHVQVSRFSTTVLSAMLAGMDDREDPDELITMEAMNGLSRIFEKIDEGHVRPILINITLRIRPCFEKARKPNALHHCILSEIIAWCNDW